MNHKIPSALGRGSYITGVVRIGEGMDKQLDGYLPQAVFQYDSSAVTRNPTTKCKAITRTVHERFFHEQS
jgi:hypothetical protein